jgi:HK97 family phage major capsid protein
VSVDALLKPSLRKRLRDMGLMPSLNAGTSFMPEPGERLTLLGRQGLDGVAYANQIPLSGASNAAGGYLLPVPVAKTFVQALNRLSAIPQLVTFDRVTTRKETWPVYLGRPVAAFVNEGAQKPVTGAEFGTDEINIKKIACIVPFTEDLLDDATEDPTVLVNEDVRGAIANLIDAHALGYQNGAAIVGNFDDESGSTTQTTELAATPGDAFRLAVSAAMALIEANGYEPNGVAAAYDLKAHIRDARQTTETTSPVYPNGPDGADPLGLGIPLKYTTNLDAFPPGAGKVAAVVADWRQARGAIRQDISISVSREATIDNSGSLIHLWQQNMVGIRYEVRVGYVHRDLNRSAAVITNAA